MTVEPQYTLEPAALPVPGSGLRGLPSRILKALPNKEGAFWVLFALIAPRFLGPIFTIGLRRFLGPGVAGTYDLAVAPYKLLDNFRNFGTGPALVYEKKVSRQVANTAWTLNMIMAVIVTGAAELLAHPIAVYYGHPGIESVFRVLAIAYIFLSVVSVHYFLLLRDMDFRARSVPPVGQVIAAGDLAVLFAIWGYGVGALVARELTSAIAGAILLWAVYPFRPSFEFVPRIAWKLFKYGAWIGAGLTILYLSQNVDVFIGGRIIRSTKNIGFYTTSWKLSFIGAGVFTQVASSMVFSSLSRLQDDLTALRAILLKAVRQMGLLMFPTSVLLACIAPVIIVPILGEKFAIYRSSFIVLSMLAFYAGNRTMLSVPFEGYKAIGKPWIVWAYNTVKLGIMIPAMIFGAEHGIVGLALTYIPIQIIEFPVALYLANRILHVSPGQVWRATRVPVTATAVMAVSAVLVEVVFLRFLHSGDLPALAVSILVGISVYISGLLLLDRGIFKEGFAVLNRGL